MVQLIQNIVRVLDGTAKIDHISPVLVSLPWPPVHFGIQFRILLMTYKVPNDPAPSYLRNLFQIFTPSLLVYSHNVRVQNGTQSF